MNYENFNIYHNFRVLFLLGHAEEDTLIERSDDSSEGPNGPSVFYANLIPDDEEAADADMLKSEEQSDTDLLKFEEENHIRQFLPQKWEVNHLRKRSFRRPIKLFSHLLDFFKSRNQRDNVRMPNAEYFLFPGALRKRDNIDKHHALIRRKIRNDGRLETQILSKKYLVNIIRREPVKDAATESIAKKSVLSQKPSMKPGVRRSDFISADDSALGRPDTEAIHPAALDGIEQDRAMNTLKDTLLQKSRTAERPDDDDHYIMDEDKSLSLQNRHIVEIIERKKHDKRKLTKLFVHFMEDMAEKLHLNPISVAGQLVRRIGEKRSRVTSRHKNKRVTVIEDGTYSKKGKILNEKNN